jgi:hypothetical protein
MVVLVVLEEEEEDNIMRTCVRASGSAVGA